MNGKQKPVLKSPTGFSCHRQEINFTLTVSHTPSTVLLAGDKSNVSFIAFNEIQVIWATGKIITHFTELEELREKYKS